MKKKIYEYILWKKNKFSKQNKNIKACIAKKFYSTNEEKIEKILTENDNNWISSLPALKINYINSSDQLFDELSRVCDT